MIITLFLTATTATELLCDTASKPVPWEHLGPAGYDDGEGSMISVASSGAAQAAVHVNGTSWLLATANGGIWKTDDVTASPEPTWKQALDDQPVTCTSVSSMSPAVGGIILAGCGAATSSEMGYTWDVANSGDWGGVMLSRDGGTTWAMTTFPANYYVSSLIVIDPSTFLVAARSNYYNKTAGGVWKSKDGGKTWVQVLTHPVFELRYKQPHVFAAVPWADDPLESLFIDSGEGFTPWAQGLTWGGRKPFYPTFALGEKVVFVGALTVDPKNLSNTSSSLYVRDLSELPTTRGTDAAPGGGAGGWKPVANAPKLDEDGMPKDRMALLVNPKDDNMLFVAGNAGALAWRVAWRTGVWTEAFGKDTKDNTSPHGDCRNYYWEPTTSSLILLNDGGAHMRTMPTKKGGSWHSLSGNTGAMEFISAAYEPTTKSWVAGAQDNCVQFSYNATPAKRAIGFIEGDGTVVAIDATVKPPRFYGATQFLGNFEDDDAPHSRRRRARRQMAVKDDDEEEVGDDDRVGFGYATYDPSASKLSLTGIPVLDWFTVSQFPFFDHPYGLNTSGTTKDDGLPVLVWARAGKSGPSGFYQVFAGDDKKSVAPILMQPTDGDVYVFVAGGKIKTKPDPSLLVALNNTHLMHRSSMSKYKMMAYPLPTPFAKPVEFAFSSPSSYILGPVSHDRTVSMAVHPDDALTVAVSGWTSIKDNNGKEAVHLSMNGGKTFVDVTGDLSTSTGVCSKRAKCGKWRPSALLLLPGVSGATVLLVGTVSGVYATAIKPGRDAAAPIQWSRLGGCKDLPLVLIGGLSYEPTSDTVVVATMGRGVYTLSKATELIGEALGL